MQILGRLQMTRDQNAGHDSQYAFTSFLHLIHLQACAGKAMASRSGRRLFRSSRSRR